MESRPFVLAALACATLVAGSLAAPLTAHAGVPDPRNCIVDHVIIASFDAIGAYMGVTPCQPSPQPGFDVWVRDVANTPIAGVTVTVQFAGTGTGIKPFLAQNSGVTVDCQQRTLTMFTDATGHANMVPRFGHNSMGQPVIPVYANGVLLQNIEARSPDYDGDGQISFAELNQTATDYFSANYVPESDFDDCPSTKLGDFLFFARQYLWDQGHAPEAHCP